MVHHFKISLIDLLVHLLVKKPFCIRRDRKNSLVKYIFEAAFKICSLKYLFLYSRKKYMGRSWLFSITKAWEPSALLHINFFRNSTFDQIFTYLWQIWWTLRTLLFYRTFFIDAYEIRTKRHDKYLSRVNSWVFLHALLLFFRERELGFQALNVKLNILVLKIGCLSYRLIRISWNKKII